MGLGQLQKLFADRGLKKPKSIQDGKFMKGLSRVIGRARRKEFDSPAKRMRFESYLFQEDLIIIQTATSDICVVITRWYYL